MIKVLTLEIEVEEITRIENMPGGGIDIRISDYPLEDLSIETKKWENIQAFIADINKEEVD